MNEKKREIDLLEDCTEHRRNKKKKIIMELLMIHLEVSCSSWIMMFMRYNSLVFMMMFMMMLMMSAVSLANFIHVHMSGL